MNSIGVKMWSNLFSAGTDLDSDAGTDMATGADTEICTDTEIRTDGGSDADAHFYAGTANQISRDLYWR